MTKCHRRPLGSGPQEPASPVPVLGQNKLLTWASQVTPGPGCGGAVAGARLCLLTREDPSDLFLPQPLLPGSVPPHTHTCLSQPLEPLLRPLPPIRGSPLDPSSTQNPPTAPPPGHESGHCPLPQPHLPWIRPWGPTPLGPAFTGPHAAPDHALGWWGSRPGAPVTSGTQYRSAGQTIHLLSEKGPNTSLLLHLAPPSLQPQEDLPFLGQPRRNFGGWGAQGHEAGGVSAPSLQQLSLGEWGHILPPSLSPLKTPPG